MNNKDGVPYPVGELAGVLFAEILRQTPGTIDLSENEDRSLVAVFDALDLRQLAAAVLRGGKL